MVATAVKSVNSSLMYTSKAFENGTSARNILEYSLSDKAKADRESVVALLAQNVSYEQAIAQFDNDDNFNQWYETTKASLEELVK